MPVSSVHGLGGKRPLDMDPYSPPSGGDASRPARGEEEDGDDQLGPSSSSRRRLMEEGEIEFDLSIHHHSSQHLVEHSITGLPHTGGPPAPVTVQDESMLVPLPPVSFDDAYDNDVHLQEEDDHDDDHHQDGFTLDGGYVGRATVTVSLASTGCRTYFATESSCPDSPSSSTYSLMPLPPISLEEESSEEDDTGLGDEETGEELLGGGPCSDPPQPSSGSPSPHAEELEHSVQLLSMHSQPAAKRKEIWDLTVTKLQRAPSDACLRKSVLILNMAKQLQDNSGSSASDLDVDFSNASTASEDDLQKPLYYNGDLNAEGDNGNFAGDTDQRSGYHLADSTNDSYANNQAVSGGNGRVMNLESGYNSHHSLVNLEDQFDHHVGPEDKADTSDTCLDHDSSSPHEDLPTMVPVFCTTNNLMMSSSTSMIAINDSPQSSYCNNISVQHQPNSIISNDSSYHSLLDVSSSMVVLPADACSNNVRLTVEGDASSCATDTIVTSVDTTCSATTTPSYSCANFMSSMIATKTATGAGKSAHLSSSRAVLDPQNSTVHAPGYDHPQRREVAGDGESSCDDLPVASAQDSQACSQLPTFSCLQELPTATPPSSGTDVVLNCAETGKTFADLSSSRHCPGGGGGDLKFYPAATTTSCNPLTSYVEFSTTGTAGDGESNKDKSISPVVVMHNKPDKTYSSKIIVDSSSSGEETTTKSSEQLQQQHPIAQLREEYLKSFRIIRGDLTGTSLPPSTVPGEQPSPDARSADEATDLDARVRGHSPEAPDEDDGQKVVMMDFTSSPAPANVQQAGGSPNGSGTGTSTVLLTHGGEASYGNNNAIAPVGSGTSSPCGGSAGGGAPPSCGFASADRLRTASDTGSAASDCWETSLCYP